MRARLVVFPIKGRNWCFSRSIDSTSRSASSLPPPTLKDLWQRITSTSRPMQANVEMVADFVAEKMNRAWIGLEKAPDGTIKSKIHSLGLRLLSGVKPSEIFLKSVSKDITEVEIMFPASLNPRLVRRRLRHIAMRGSAIHKKYFYGSVSLLPISTVFSVLPLPNIPFFWILFRAYSHWRALKGSERLMLLVSDDDNQRPWVLQPSDELKRRLVIDENAEDGVSNCTISSICKAYDLDNKDVIKYKDSLS